MPVLLSCPTIAIFIETPISRLLMKICYKGKDRRDNKHSHRENNTGSHILLPRVMWSSSLEEGHTRIGVGWSVCPSCLRGRLSSSGVRWAGQLGVGEEGVGWVTLGSRTSWEDWGPFSSLGCSGTRDLQGTGPHFNFIQIKNSCYGDYIPDIKPGIEPAFQ